MRKLIIERKKSFLGCRIIALVICDGDIIGSVRSGSTAEMEITDNKHTVYCIFQHARDEKVRPISDVINIPESTSDVNMLLTIGMTVKLSIV